MRSKDLFKVLLILVLALAPSCTRKSENGKSSTPVQQVELPKIGFSGWNSLFIESPFVRLDVVPELGGKIMGYDLSGYQILWHDAKKEGHVEKEQGYGYGQNYFNPGGAKVWPAPQGWSGKTEWPGPPDNVLDSAAYEGVLAEDKITVTSPKDTGEGRSGLQFTHTYSLAPYSSIVNLNLSMTNVVEHPVTWGLWHLATVPVDRDVMVYVPVNKGDWHVVYGDKANPQWMDVKDGMFRARYDKKAGKVGMKVSKGWAAWFDVDKGVAFVMMFPVQKGAQYPDGGSQFEISTSGAGSYRANNQDITTEYDADSAIMELGVMGPIVKLNPGQTAKMDVTWATCRCSGVYDVNPGGVVVEELAVKGDRITGKFGVFFSGYLQAMYLDKNGNQIGLNNIGEISPLSEISIDMQLSDFPKAMKKVRYQVFTYDKKTVKEICEMKL